MPQKKKDFGAIAEKTLRRPESMSDFLSNGEEQKGRGSADQQPTDPETPEAPVKADPPVTTLVEKEESLSLSEQTTFYLDINICEILDNLWIKLRQMAPKGRKKRISKSLIVNRMVEFCNESLEKEGLVDSKLVEMILED